MSRGSKRIASLLTGGRLGRGSGKWGLEGWHRGSSVAHGTSRAASTDSHGAETGMTLAVGGDVSGVRTRWESAAHIRAEARGFHGVHGMKGISIRLKIK